MRRKTWKQNDIIVALVVVLSLSLAGCAFPFSKKEENISDVETSIEAENENADYHSIIYNNKKYVYNTQITSLLYAGVDASEVLTTTNRYTIAPRADSVELVILDNYHKSIKILALSRDTITEVERYTMNGNSRGTYETQLGYAYAYGDGGKNSCTNLTEAVSNLLGEIPIHEYVVTNNGSVKQLNNMLGGITVKVPNDDLVKEYPELKKDAIVTLDESNAEAFVRWRDTSIPFTNNGRMERQQAFSSSFLQKFMEQISTDANVVWKKIESMSSCLQTSINKSQYLTLAELLNQLNYSEADYYYLEGENVQGEQHDEFYPDENALEKMIIELFYLEDGEVE